MCCSSMSIDEPNDARRAAWAYFMKRGVDPIRHGGAGMRTFLNIAELWSLRKLPSQHWAAL